MKSITHVWPALCLILLGPVAWSQESSSDRAPVEAVATDSSETAGEGQRKDAPTGDNGPDSISSDTIVQESASGRRQIAIAGMTIFVLAVFVGFEVITKVPPTLHTPLMSGSNAISGITLVGAIIAAAGMNFTSFMGFVAVTLATINAVGGFLVTHRMLAMFTKK